MDRKELKILRTRLEAEGYEYSHGVISDTLTGEGGLFFIHPGKNEGSQYRWARIYQGKVSYFSSVSNP